MKELKPRLSAMLTHWYSLNKRELPWRNTKNPYKIWLSEVILQQTRVVQGTPYFHKFVNEFPTVKALADADEDKVLLLWQGLGYYSRARNLHQAAKTVVDEFNGTFPTNYKDIRSLKGIGDYTAAAIASFAFNLPHAAVDGNVYRVLSRIYGVATPINTTQGKKEFDQLAQYIIDEAISGGGDAGLHNQAIMEFGALQCVPASPDCTICPLADSCVALATDTIKSLPAKQGKTKVRSRYLNYIDIRCNGKLLLRRRPAGDIWEGLYEFPLVESKSKLDWNELINTPELQAILQNSTVTKVSHILSEKHILSHQRIFAEFYQIEVDKIFADSYLVIDENTVQDYGVSRLIEKYLEI